MPELLSIDINGTTATLRGLDFGFAPGRVIVSPSADKDDPLAVSLVILAWTDDQVQVTMPAAIPCVSQGWFVEDINGFANLDPFLLILPADEASTGWWESKHESIGWWESKHESIGWWEST
mgnify:CR=1 FL=1